MVNCHKHKLFFYTINHLKGLNDDDDEEDGENNVDLDDRLSVPTALPAFSKRIQTSLIIGDFWTNDSIRYQFITELAVFFQTNNILLANSTHYKAVGITILKKYENFANAMNNLCDKENQARLSSFSNSRRPKLVQPWVCGFFKLK